MEPAPPLHTRALALQTGTLRPHIANLEFKPPDFHAYPKDDLSLKSLPWSQFLGL